MRSSFRLLGVSILCALLGAPAAAARPRGNDDESNAARLVEVVISSSSAEDPAPPQPFGPPSRNFRGRLDFLRQIASDDDVDGVRLELHGIPSYAHVLDLLAELENVKAAGKRIVCYAEGLDQRDLVVATVADLLVVPPSGLIGLEGITIEIMYLADLLAKVDVAVEVLHVGDYKTAYEDLALNRMSDEQRATLEALADEFYNELLGIMASNRGIEVSAVEELFDLVLVDPQVARDAGLIDAVGYEDEFDSLVETMFGVDVVLVEDYGEDEGKGLEELFGNPFALMANLDKVLHPAPPPAPDEPHVAIVYASGTITSGKSQADFQGHVASMGSDTVVEALDKVGQDDNVKAVVLRVNSPGGSALASDMVWRAIQRVREKKPVIASMGSVAASGGYWISMGCDVIVAQPSTITGSIGVVSMVPNVSAALENLGIQVEVIARGPHGDQLALIKHGVTPVVRSVLQRMMNGVYEEFIAKVAQGRGLDASVVRELAKGRVWTGRQAEQNGLVDSLGSLEDAIHMACVMGGGLDSLTTPVAEYPVAPGFLSQMEEAMREGVVVHTALDTLAAQLGAGDLARYAAMGMGTRSWLQSDTVQCIMPMRIHIR